MSETDIEAASLRLICDGFVNGSAVRAMAGVRTPAMA